MIEYICTGCGERDCIPLPVGEEPCCMAEDCATVRVNASLRDENKCPLCHGRGYTLRSVTDWVSYGSTNVPMESWEVEVCPLCLGNAACPSCGVQGVMGDFHWQRGKAKHEISLCINCGFEIDWDGELEPSPVTPDECPFD